MQIERMVKALANRRRLAILKFLARQKEASVADIAVAIKLSFKATSKHLLLMAHVDILDRRQENLTMYYRLAKPTHLIVRTVLDHL